MTRFKVAITILAAVMLSACAEPILDEQTASQVVVQQVNVSTANFSRVTGRSINKPAAQVQADLSNALNSRLQGAGAPGGSPVAVNVSVESVALVSPGQSLLVGGTSSVTATVSVVELSTQRELAPATRVTSSGEGYAPGGVIGASTRGTPEADYAQTVQSFASVLTTRIFGRYVPVQQGPSVAVGGSSSGGLAPIGGGAPTSAVGNNAMRESAWQM